MFSLSTIVRWLTGVIVLCSTLSSYAQGIDTLAKLKNAGTITMGVREASGVLSYSPAVGQYVGYQVDICHRIIANIEAAIQRKLEVKYQLVTSQNRIPLIANGTVDMECGSTTNNVARQVNVAFVNTTFIEPVRMLVRADSTINSIADLNGKTVVTTSGGNPVQLLRKSRKTENIQFIEVYGKDHADSFLLVESGRADAFVMDNSLIAGLRARSKDPRAFKIVGESLSTEPIAIAIPKGDAALKKIADDTVAQLSSSGEITKIYDKWFMQPTPPANVVMNLPMSDDMKYLIAHPNDKPAEDYQKP